MHYPNIYVVTTLDSRILQIQDISIWDPNITIINPLIKINIPGSNTDFYPIFKIMGSSYYSTKTFDLTDTSLEDLPDGIYSCTISVCPNDEVYTNTKFLRDQVTRNLVYQNLSNILGTDCPKILDCYGKDITSKRIQDLKDLLLILDIAQNDTRNFKYSDAVNKLDYVNTILNIFN